MTFNSVCAVLVGLLLASCTVRLSAVTVEDLYPFGAEHGDTVLTTGSAGWEEGGEVRLRDDFRFYGRSYRIIHVSLHKDATSREQFLKECLNN